MSTTPGIGPGGWDAGKLAREQEHKAGNTAVSFRLYTEDYPNLREITAQYFSGFTLIPTEGNWEGVSENAVIIEVVGVHSDLQTIVHLAGDIRAVNNQTAVLVTWTPTSSLLVSA